MEYDIRCLRTHMDCRATFPELVQTVVAEVERFGLERPVHVMGESFGALLAIAVALEMPQHVSRLVLVNPATSFRRSALYQAMPYLVGLPRPLFPLGLLWLGSKAADAVLVDRVLSGAVPLPLKTRARTRYLLNFLLSLPQQVEPFTPEALSWRLSEWLSVATSHPLPAPADKGHTKDHGEGGDGPGDWGVLDRLEEVVPQVLVICGTGDKLLPSEEEASVLAARLPRCRVHLVEGAGHAGTLDERVPLPSLLAEWACDMET
ncbi:unnamed protein product [Discosporangium mesarthrocarpum]